MPTARLFDYTIAYHSDTEYHALKDEVFTKDTYYVELDTPSPNIIDAGAHIGMSTLYFKRLWFQAKILAIEPHPQSFKLLQENIETNQLQDVIPLQTALVNSDKQSTILYADPEESWLQSASLTKGAWNQRETHSEAITVPATRLSTLITEPVDLLKLDIEGAENTVIDDVIQQNKLRYCKQLIIEFHQTKNNILNTFIQKIFTQGYSLIDTKTDQKRNKPNQTGLYVLNFSVSE